MIETLRHEGSERTTGRSCPSLKWKKEGKVGRPRGCSSVALGQIPLWKPCAGTFAFLCACSATMPESEIKARLRKEPGLYTDNISTSPCTVNGAFPAVGKMVMRPTTPPSIFRPPVIGFFISCHPRGGPSDDKEPSGGHTTEMGTASISLPLRASVPRIRTE